jgi:DNA-binding transcriptional MerR regulator
MSYSVGELADLAGVTVRTLHHYDEIGLLQPGVRSSSGHRRYGRPELVRLREILGYRELGLGLEAIRAILDTDEGLGEHLARHHAMLKQRLERLQVVLEDVERMMEKEGSGMQLTDDEMFEVFGDFDPAQHEAEARDRWGGSEAYEESARRTASYSKDDWLTIQREAADIEDRFRDAMANGESAAGDTAMTVAEEHRAHIGRWFYDCPPQLHRALGEMYETDERFAAHYEARMDGLAAYVSRAVSANADRQLATG